MFLKGLDDCCSGLTFPAVVISTGCSGWERERFSRSFLPGRCELLLYSQLSAADSSKRGPLSGCGKLRGATHFRLVFGRGGRDDPLSGVDCEAKSPRSGTAGTGGDSFFPVGVEVLRVLRVCCSGNFLETAGHTLLEEKKNLLPQCECLKPEGNKKVEIGNSSRSISTGI